MGSTDLERRIQDRQRAARRSVAEQLREARLEAGLSLRTIGTGAGIDPSHVLRIERGVRGASLDATVALATALGREVSVRLFESAGPHVRDHVQTRMVEALLQILSGRWIARLEVPVHRPARGVIDMVLQDRDTSQLVAGEAHGELRAVEQQLRRAAEKADSIPSARGWPWANVLAPPPVSRLLLLRSTVATRDLVRSLPALFRAAYPAPAEQAYAALTSGIGAWPGPALLWVNVEGARTHVLQGSPRRLAAGWRPRSRASRAVA